MTAPAVHYCSGRFKATGLLLGLLGDLFEQALRIIWLERSVKACHPDRWLQENIGDILMLYPYITLIPDVPLA
jgi:hypothetical protein